MASLLCSAILAEGVPSLITYQGRLTDDSGAPVSDGSYEMTFKIYNDKYTTKPLWTSTTGNVSVTGGIFRYNLGSSPAFPDNLFSDTVIFLGITVGSDDEISPRVRLQSVPYAYHALRADTAEELGNADQFVLATGDTITGNLVFRAFDVTTSAILEQTASGGNLWMFSDGDNTAILAGQTFGSLYLKDGDETTTAVLDAHSSSGGELILRNGGGTTQINLDAGETGDDAVILPADALNSDEIADEFGFASTASNDVTMIEDTLNMIDIVTVSITTPAAGYIYVSANCNVHMTTTTSGNGAYFQIDDEEGGSKISGYYTYIYQNAFPNVLSYYYNAHSDRVFYASEAGTFTFRLEAMKSPVATGTISAMRPIIIARYISTSYGTIQTVASDHSGFDTAIPVTSQDEFGRTTTSYEVDLRELELKAKQAQLEEKEAMLKRREAELELEQARRGHE